MGGGFAEIGGDEFILLATDRSEVGLEVFIVQQFLELFEMPGQIGTHRSELGGLQDVVAASDAEVVAVDMAIQPGVGVVRP